MPAAADRSAETSSARRPKSVNSCLNLSCNISMAPLCCSVFTSSTAIRPRAFASSASLKFIERRNSESFAVNSSKPNSSHIC
jgi:hypothetical protein